QAPCAGTFQGVPRQPVRRKREASPRSGLGSIFRRSIALQHLLDSLGKPVDFALRPLLGYGNDQGVFQAVVILACRNSGSDPLFQQRRNNRLGRLREGDRELVERRSGLKQLDSRDRCETALGILCLVTVQGGHLLQAFFSDRGEEDQSAQGAEPLVAADVGGRLVALDMLFPRLQGKDEASLAVTVDC